MQICTTSTPTDYLAGTERISRAEKGLTSNRPESGTARNGYIFHGFHAIHDELVTLIQAGMDRTLIQAGMDRPKVKARP
jgi:hypothetical protein